MSGLSGIRAARSHPEAVKAEASEKESECHGP